jgi:hypothetical protein
MSNITTDQIFELLSQARSGRVTRKNLQKFLLNPDGEKKDEKKTFPVTIDYGKTLEEMVVAGHYDRSNDDINSQNFPVAGSGVVTIDLELVHLDKAVSTEAVLAHMDANGLRPARIEELLAFGVTYPGIQREFPLISLGSVWRSSHGFGPVPYLSGHGGGRYLHLQHYVKEWLNGCRFLAVRK